MDVAVLIVVAITAAIVAVRITTVQRYNFSEVSVFTVI